LRHVGLQLMRMLVLAAKIRSSGRGNVLVHAKRLEATEAISVSTVSWRLMELLRGCRRRRQ